MKKSLLLTLLLATLSLNCYAVEKAPLQNVTPERAAAAIKDMDTLFNGPMSKRITGNKSEDVLTSIKASEELRQQAKQALEKQDYDAVVQLANNATKNFLEAVRKAAPPKSAAEQHEQEYKQRLSNVNTFIDALDQAVKDTGKAADSSVENIKKQIAQAKALAEEKKFAEARNLMDKALIAMKFTITSMMQGAVMTAEKDTTPKGVYEYELFRNETYKALIELLRDEKKLEVASEPEFVNFVKAGDKLHKEALGIVKSGKYEEATQKMFESTSQYKQAVSLTGISIPD